MNNDEQAAGQQVAPGSKVFDEAGQQAQALACEMRDDGTLQVILQRPQGRLLKLPRQMLLQRDDGSYEVPLAFSEVEASVLAKDERIAIPVIQEELQVGKRVVDTGRGMRVHRRIVERTEVIDEPLWKDELELRHVPIDRLVDPAALPAPRQEGDTYIVPVLEETLVIERQWRLKEELHITRHKREIHAPQTVVLKSQQVSVERFDENRDAKGTTPLTEDPKGDTNNPGKPAR